MLLDLEQVWSNHKNVVLEWHYTQIRNCDQVHVCHTYTVQLASSGVSILSMDQHTEFKSRSLADSLLGLVIRLSSYATYCYICRAGGTGPVGQAKTGPLF